MNQQCALKPTQQKRVSESLTLLLLKASQGETVAELTLDHIVNAKYQLVSCLRHYFIKEGFNFSVSSTPEHITVSVKW